MNLRSLLLLALAGLTLSACERIDPDSPLGQRKALYQQMLNTSEDLGGMLRGRLSFDEKRFAAGAVKLDELSRQPWQHYPAVREEHSKARDEVWQRQERFAELARDLEANTAALVAASSRLPLRARELAAPVERVEQACKACHEEFRIY
ncbi:cytochrome c [Pseudomonas stutzeri]|nr:cytochrome c [Stutzerimonas stutzeri]